MKRDSRGLWIVFGVLVAIAVLGPLLGGGIAMMGRGPGMMWGYGLARGAGWGAWMAFGWLFMVAFWGAVIVGIILLARAFAGRSGRAEDSARSGRTEDSAIEILRRRYAAGEISREQYEAMRADLEDASKTRR